MEHTEPPSASRLEELREQGVVAYSTFASRTAGALAVLLSLLILGPQFSILLKTLHDGIFENAYQKDQVMQLLHAAITILVVPALAGFIGAFCAGLFQTRFLIRFARVSPLFDRINPFNVTPKELVPRIGLLTTSVVLSVLFAIVLVRLVIREILSLANSDAQRMVPWLTSFFEAILPILIMILSFSGFAAWLFVRHRFFDAHKMTRAELAQEGERR